jgi:cytochrome c-type biogenesis protein
MEVFQLVFAFSLGLASVLTPCVFPIIPGYLAYLFGRERFEMVKGGVAIFAGILSGGLALGVVMGLLGEVTSTRWFYLAAAVMLLAIMVLKRANRIRQAGFASILGNRKGAATAFLFGALIIFIASPCILPLLSIVAIIALTVEGVLSRVALLIAYSAGLGIPFILIGAFSNMSGRLRRLVATEAAGRIELLIMALTLAWLISAFALS